MDSGTAVCPVFAPMDDPEAPTSFRVRVRTPLICYILPSWPVENQPLPPWLGATARKFQELFVAGLHPNVAPPRVLQTVATT